MTYQHKELSQGRWMRFSFIEQMANIGSEVERAIVWREKNEDYAKKAFVRQLELLDLTIADPKNCLRLKELTRLREVLVDYFAFDNQYRSSHKLWRSYFYPFNFAVRKGL
ncbi:MAG: hypothetical protein HZA27_01145 [Candidatus Omnitrophica bacterium]|nr:hypothetical protein [Candidatus Omnitrophota bacterium]MBI5144773.1 hypothetical protein [Candidatus Omnitrophota bacterium]